jgi:hypothetical protein
VDADLAAQLVRRDRRIGEAGQLGLELSAVEEQPLSGRQVRGVAGHGQAELGARVGAHVLDAVGRVGRVDRHVGAAGLGDGPDSCDRLDRAGDPQRDHVFGADAPGDQGARDLVRPAVQLAVADLDAVEHERRGVRVRGGGVGENLAQRADRRRRAANDRRELRQLLRREQLQLPVPRVRSRGELVEHSHDPVEHGLHMRVREHIGEVLELDVQRVVEVRDQAHRIVRRVCAIQPRHLHSGEVGLLLPAEIHRVGLEHREGVEAGARPCRALDVCQAHVVVVEQRGLLPLHTAEQVL